MTSRCTLVLVQSDPAPGWLYFLLQGSWAERRVAGCFAVGALAAAAHIYGAVAPAAAGLFKVAIGCVVWNLGRDVTPSPKTAASD